MPLFDLHGQSAWWTPWVWLHLAALGTSLLAFVAARRAEQMFDRVCDLNRDRLNLLDRGLQAVALRSRLEYLAQQLEYAVPAAGEAWKMLAVVVALQWTACAGAAAAGLLGAPSLTRVWPWLDLAWLCALGSTGAWLWRQIQRAARIAAESTAHARRYEFLFVSSIRKNMEP